MTVRIINADVLAGLAQIEPESVRCVVTSPPYWGLRNYGVPGQIGLELRHDCLGWATKAPCGECYVCRMVEVFRAVRRVLTKDGTVWLNLGDAWSGGGRGGNPGRSVYQKQLTNVGSLSVRGVKRVAGKPKDLIGLPWATAFALRADGWYLRQEVVWEKPNAMTESVRDRCTRSHEQLFMLSRSGRYYYDFQAIREPIAETSRRRISQTTFADQKGDPKDYGRTGVDPNRSARKALENFARNTDGMRNRRTVWTVPTKGYKGAHFATFPEKLIEPCILAGSASGDLVLDPFGGSGTTAAVALKHGRRAILIEINREYCELARQRVAAAA